MKKTKKKTVKKVVAKKSAKKKTVKKVVVKKSAMPSKESLKKAAHILGIAGGIKSGQSKRSKKRSNYF